MTAAFDGPILFFGGPYGNAHATRALLAEAARLGVPPTNIVCTGDVIAYCAEPSETIALLRDAGVRVVQGNCDAQIGAGAEDCGCGFEEGSLCDSLSAAWFGFARERVGADDKAWLAALPPRLDVTLGGRRLAVIHGGVERNNTFIFGSTPVPEMLAEFAQLDCDGVVAGHCGLPFTRVIHGRLWHNPGVIGMPANDGTASVWFSMVSDEPMGLRILHRRLDYDAAGAAAAMREASLTRHYADALVSGLWPSMDVLPFPERRRAGEPLSPGDVLWAGGPADGPLWPVPHEAAARRNAPSSGGEHDVCSTQTEKP
ncbi:MAG: metallophosphoesterase family protein [Hyphomicrobiales bacterium]|nr:metallophosphoesterase family protein [Hyphomicrobiales bacterium]